MVDEDEMMVDDEVIEKGLDRDLELQISNAIDSRFLLQLVRNLDISCLLALKIIYLLALCGIFIIFDVS